MIVKLNTKDSELFTFCKTPINLPLFRWGLFALFYRKINIWLGFHCLCIYGVGDSDDILFDFYR